MPPRQHRRCFFCGLIDTGVHKCAKCEKWCCEECVKHGKCPKCRTIPKHPPKKDNGDNEGGAPPRRPAWYYNKGK